MNLECLDKSSGMREESFLVIQQRQFRFCNPSVMTRTQAQAEHLEVRSHSSDPRSIAQEVPMRLRWIGLPLLVKPCPFQTGTRGFVFDISSLK
jgi:hypothetical protein